AGAEPGESSPQHDTRLLARPAERHAEVVAEEIARPLEDGARQLRPVDRRDLVREALGERRVAHGRLRLPMARAANASIAARVSGARHTAQIGSSPPARAAARRKAAVAARTAAPAIAWPFTAATTGFSSAKRPVKPSSKRAMNALASAPW